MASLFHKHLTARFFSGENMIKFVSLMVIIFGEFSKFREFHTHVFPIFKKLLENLLNQKVTQNLHFGESVGDALNDYFTLYNGGSNEFLHLLIKGRTEK